MIIRSSLLACLVLAGAASGCGGSQGGAAGDPLSDDEARTLCEDICDHFVACGWATDLTACIADCRADSGMFRGQGYRDWGECLIAASCDDTSAGEACYVDVVGSLDTRDVHEEYGTRCAALAETCPDVVLPSGVCDLDQVLLFSDDYMQTSVLPCFDLACASVAACLEENVLDAF